MQWCDNHEQPFNYCQSDGLIGCEVRYASLREFSLEAGRTAWANANGETWKENVDAVVDAVLDLVQKNQIAQRHD